MRTTLLASLTALVTTACTLTASTTTYRWVMLRDGERARVKTLANGREAVRIQCGADSKECERRADRICQSVYEIDSVETTAGVVWAGGANVMNSSPSTHTVWAHCWNPTPWVEARADPERCSNNDALINHAPIRIKIGDGRVEMIYTHKPMWEIMRAWSHESRTESEYTFEDEWSALFCLTGAHRLTSMDEILANHHIREWGLEVEKRGDAYFFRKASPPPER